MNNSDVNRIIGARVLEQHVLELGFGDGYIGRLDLSPALWGTIFEPLKDPAYFNQLQVEDDTIRWPNNADFCPDVLRYWCEVGGVQSQETTDSYFARQIIERAAS